MKVEIPAKKTVGGDDQVTAITMQTEKTGSAIYTTKIAFHEGLYSINAVDLIKALEYLLKCAT